MKFETGDYIEHTWDEHYGVVVKAEERPLGMGQEIVVVGESGVPEPVEMANFTANFGTRVSFHHHWAPGQQAEYDSLNARGRRLYDQIRTRLTLDHGQAFQIAAEYAGLKEHGWA